MSTFSPLSILSTCLTRSPPAGSLALLYYHSLLAQTCHNAVSLGSLGLPVWFRDSACRVLVLPASLSPLLIEPTVLTPRPVQATGGIGVG